MNRVLITGNVAVAWAARLARVDYVPAFPITPQTEIIETLADWMACGDMAGRHVMFESEHSMLTAAGAAAATGVRVFTATSSQGLLYAMEMVYALPGWRAPFVMVNVSRGVASPITLESDHNDILAARDSGFLQVHCATCQEALDMTLIAWRMAEDGRVRLPVLVNEDGFYLSFTREPVELPEADAVREFLPDFDPMGIEFGASRPISQAVAVLGGSPYSYFRYELHLAARAALEVWAECAAQFGERFGRHYPAIETYRIDGADVAYFMTGAFSTKARLAVDALRAAGERVGLVRPRVFRPFPDAAIRRAMVGLKAVAVVDQNLSFGKGGILATELASSLHGVKDAPLIVPFVGGLGGRDISPAEFHAMAREALIAAERGEAPTAPRLLYDQGELKTVRKLQAIAVAERRELGRAS